MQLKKNKTKKSCFLKQLFFYINNPAINATTDEHTATVISERLKYASTSAQAAPADAVIIFPVE